MARPALAVALAVLLAPALTAAPAAARPSSFHHRAHCAAAHRASAHSRARSFRRAHCPRHHGKGHSHPGGGVHLPFFTAVDGHCPDTSLTPTAANLALVRAATLCLVNRERAAHGEPALHWNGDLVRAAQNHTESMAFDGYFEHVGPRGETPLSRMRRTGYISSSHAGYEVGENIAWGSLWLGTPRAIVAAWMSDAGHRANILDHRFRDTGIGVSPHLGHLAHGQSGGIYTQDFGVIVG